MFKDQAEAWYSRSVVGAVQADRPDTSPFVSLACPESLGFEEPASTPLVVSYIPTPLRGHLMSFSKEPCGVTLIIIIPC